MNADGTNQTLLAAGNFVHPRWSPLGDKIVFSRNGDIYTMDADGTNETQLTLTSEQENYADFSPAGTSIVFFAHCNNQSSPCEPSGDLITSPDCNPAANLVSHNALYVMGADGQDPTRFGPYCLRTDPTFAPDGTKLLYRGPEGDIHTIDLVGPNGQNETRLLLRTGSDDRPDWGTVGLPPTGVAGTKFNDTDGNGSQGAGESGLGGWEIRAYADDGDGSLEPGETTVAAQAQTNQDGDYSLTLSPGAYVVCEVAQATWTQTAPAPADNECGDEVAGLADGGHPVQIATGEMVIDRDFGNAGTPASAAVICASNLDGDPNIPGRQCPDGFEYGANNPNYSFSAGNVKVKLRAGTEAVFTSDVVNIDCNRSVGNGRVADSGAADGVPNGFLFSIDWEERQGGVNSEQCPTNLTGVTANGEPIETNTGPGIWDFQAVWLADGTPPTVTGTLTLADVKASVNLPQAGLTCLIEGDVDGDGILNEGDRALALDLFNPGNIDIEEELVESAPQGESCPDHAHFSADYVIKGNTDNDGDPSFNDNLFIREDDA
jgi:hypothetical protein